MRGVYKVVPKSPVNEEEDQRGQNNSISRVQLLDDSSSKLQRGNIGDYAGDYYRGYQRGY